MIYSTWYHIPKEPQRHPYNTRSLWPCTFLTQRCPKFMLLLSFASILPNSNHRLYNWLNQKLLPLYFELWCFLWQIQHQSSFTRLIWIHLLCILTVNLIYQHRSHQWARLWEGNHSNHWKQGLNCWCFRSHCRPYRQNLMAFVNSTSYYLN